MASKISAAEAKAHLSDLIARVAYGGEHYIIERRGKPMAGLVSVQELNRLEEQPPAPKGDGDFLSLVGAWGDIPDEELDALIAHIYAERDRDTGRSVELEE